MTAEEAVRRALVRDLRVLVELLAPCPGYVALHLCRDCSGLIADLALGCHCEEAAWATVADAENFLAAAA
jgi:hypothetical protein